MVKKREIVVYSKMDQTLFDEFLIMAAGGLGALGIQDLLEGFKGVWWLKIGIAFLIILIDVQWIRKISDKKKT
ncbi:MAG: hypothetical protein AABW73_00445 [Nanoarchaeota archaeon]